MFALCFSDFELKVGLHELFHNFAHFSVLVFVWAWLFLKTFFALTQKMWIHSKLQVVQRYGHPVLLWCGNYGNLKEHQMFHLKCEGIICDTVPEQKKKKNSLNPNDFSSCPWFLLEQSIRWRHPILPVWEKETAKKYPQPIQKLLIFFIFGSLWVLSQLKLRIWISQIFHALAHYRLSDPQNVKQSFVCGSPLLVKSQPHFPRQVSRADLSGSLPWFSSQQAHTLEEDLFVTHEGKKKAEWIFITQHYVHMYRTTAVKDTKMQFWPFFFCKSFSHQCS